ncbi:MAG: 3'(2'),5'-bisphosphate nucleotidase [Phycisphaerales bacterium]|nr:3'(2'),5'-bisphosphate nucleotidase [Phycisphaerales bacterium]
MLYANERSTALEAVEMACRLCIAVRTHLVSDESVAKKDKSPVTVADFGVQAVVTTHLLAAFPDIPVVGEEDASALRDPANRAILEKVLAHVEAVTPGLTDAAVLDAIDRGTHAGGGRGRHWALDPIDGTKGFLRADQYAVALALVEDGEVVLGILGCPNLPQEHRDPAGPRGCIFVATRGEGAFQRPLEPKGEAAIHVSEIDEPQHASFCESVESGHTQQDDSAKIAEQLGVTAPPVRMDSQCKYAAIARGDSSIYLRMPTRADYEERIWDHAAGWIVVKEAGGEVTDIHGKPLDFSLGRTLRANKGVVATNGRLHAEVLAAIRTVVG